MIAEVLCITLISLGFPRAEASCQYMEYVVEASNQHSVDPALLSALIRVESRWKPDAVSYAGACGLTQVLAKYSDYTCKELKDPKTSIFEGARKLNFWLYRYGKGNLRVGLCGYNAGFRCKGKNKNHRGYNRYAPKVLKYYKEIKERYCVLEEEYFLENPTWFEDCGG
tara:strand:+ start:485 stop:988 length:504 start_codon:yes stop_codon:yes gene_type:complete